MEAHTDLKIEIFAEERRVATDQSYGFHEEAEKDEEVKVEI